MAQFAAHQQRRFVQCENLLKQKRAPRLHRRLAFSNHWDANRSQYNAITYKSVADQPRSGQGSPWSVSEEIVMENTQVSHINGAFGVAREYDRPGTTYDPLKPQHIRVYNTLLTI